MLLRVVPDPDVRLNIGGDAELGTDRQSASQSAVTPARIPRCEHYRRSMAVPSPSWSCDSFVVMPDATVAGRLLFGKNSDRPARECQPLRRVRGSIRWRQVGAGVPADS